MCPHECTSPSDSLEKAKSTMRKSLGMGMIGAELYRWKGVEDANGYYHRGRSQHEILSNAIKMHWDKEACDKAIAAVADAEENKVAELLTFTTTNSAKAGLILRDMDKDTNNETSFRLTLLTRPVQHFLNATFAADELAVDFMNKQAMDADGPETQKARAALFKANLEFFDGTRGRQVLSEYLGMITDLAGKAWDGWKGSAETKLVYAKKLLLPMVGAWRRLVVPFTDNDAFELLASSGIDGIETYSVEELTRLGLKLEAKMAVCKDCVDQGFASEMLPEIRSNPMFVHDACADNVLMLRVGSGVVERAHRSGQELKPVKSKGIALDAQALAMTTYRKSAIAEGRWLLDKVKGKVLRERNICPSEMARHAKSFRFGNIHTASYKAFGNKKTKKLRLLGGQKKVGLSRRSDGHKKFRRSVWQCEARVGTPEFVAEERRVSMLWSAMSPESKALWDAESKLEDACLLSVPNGSSMNDVNAAVAKAGNVSVGRAMSLRREAVASAMEAIASHAAWDNGLGLCSMTSALKPEFVTNDPIPTCRTLVKDVFGHDGTIVENPKVDTSPSMPCAIKNWGLCSKDSLLQSCKRGTLNIYRQLKQLKHNSINLRSQFPIFAKLSVLDEVVWVAICDTIGRGETVVVALVNVDSDENVQLQQVKVANRSEPRCAFSQQIIQQLLNRAAAKNKMSSPTSIVEMSVSYFVDAKPVDLEGSLAFRLAQETRCKVPLNSVVPVTAGAESSGGSTIRKTFFGLSDIAFGSQSNQKMMQKQSEEEQLGGAGGGADKDQDKLDKVKVVKEKKMDAGGDAAEDTDAGEDLAIPDPSDAWDGMPSGSKLGVMGIDKAPGHAAKCWVCVAKGETDKKINTVKKNEIRMWYRLKPGQAEKSMHVRCLADACNHKCCKDSASSVQIQHSIFFLKKHKDNTSFGDDLREVMETALVTLQALG